MECLEWLVVKLGVLFCANGEPLEDSEEGRALLNLGFSEKSLGQVMPVAGDTAKNFILDL